MNAWKGIEGAARYAEAIANGDLADAPTQDARLEQCRACPTLTVNRVPLLGVYALFCGPPLEEGEGYCGCLVATAPKATGTRDQQEQQARCQATAAGKPCVASERCPRGKW